MKRPSKVDTTTMIAHHINIVIDNHFVTKVYTSGSLINGKAIIIPGQDVFLNRIDIVFTGIAATRTDFAQTKPSFSSLPFLKVYMPLQGRLSSGKTTIKAGQPYTVPFHFVVPYQLPIGSCDHDCKSDVVRKSHLNLPPTIGPWDVDDEAADIVQIEYAIKARVIVTQSMGEPVHHLRSHHLLKILPGLTVDRALTITARDERYTLSKTKTIRKSLFSKRSGQFTATSTEPRAVMLSADGRRASTSGASISLEYAVDSLETPPPNLSSVAIKLVSTTFFSSLPANRLPNLGPRTTNDGNPSLSLCRSRTLSCTTIGGKLWENITMKSFHDSFQRRNSQADLGGTDTSLGAGSVIRHSARLYIPFEVIDNRNDFILPSFQSCLISRTYTLRIILTVGRTNTTVTLTVPLQIGVESTTQPGQEICNDDSYHRCLRPTSESSNSLPSYDDLHH